MTVVSRMENRKRWRTRKREEGWSWFCIYGSGHDLCSGKIGRLVKRMFGDNRPLCHCPCHKQEQDPWSNWE